MSTSRFDDMFDRAAAPVAVYHAGSAVTVHRDGINAATVTAIVGNVEAREDIDADGKRKIRHTRSVTFLTDTANAFGGLTNPNKTDEVEIDSERWAIIAVTRQTESMVTVECERCGIIERTRPNYRGGRP